MIKYFQFLICISFGGLASLTFGLSTVAQTNVSLVCDEEFDENAINLPEVFEGVYYYIADNNDNYPDNYVIHQVTQSGTQSYSLPISSRILESVVSPDGHLIAFRSGITREIIVSSTVTNELVYFPMDSATVDVLLGDPYPVYRAINQLVWNGNNELIIQEFEEDSLKLVSQRTIIVQNKPLTLSYGSETIMSYPILTAPSENFYPWVDLSPLGNYALVTSVQGVPNRENFGKQIDLYTTENQELILTVEPTESLWVSSGPIWSPNDSFVFFIAGRPVQEYFGFTIVPINFQTGSLDLSYTQDLINVFGQNSGLRDLPPKWNPDGTKLAFSYYSSIDNRFYMVIYDSVTQSTTAICDRENASNQSNLLHPFWSPDSQYVGYWEKGEVYVFDVTSGERYRFPNPTYDYFVGWTNFIPPRHND